MLYALYGGNVKQITDIPRNRRAFFNTMIRNLSDDDYAKIIDALNKYFDEVEKVGVSSFVPGSDWTGTVYEPIYYACNENVEYSGYFFGLILWKVMIERPDYWGFDSAKGHFINREIRGTIYFRIDNPSELP